MYYEEDEEHKSNIIIAKCNFCTLEVINPPKSKRLVICANCAHFAKYGESLFDAQKRKQKEAQKRAKERKEKKEKKLAPPQYKPAQKQKISYFSEKGKKRYNDISDVKKRLREQAQRTEQNYCQGCYRGDIALDCSHILSVAQRPDLETDINNINLLCRKCHVVHESGNITLMLELNCFEKDMRYIFHHDETRFNKLLYKLLDHVEKYPNDTKASAILKRIELFEVP